MKWFTPTIQDGFENVWTRKGSGAPYWEHGDPSAVQFINDNKPVLMQPLAVIQRYPLLRQDLDQWHSNSFLFFYKHAGDIHDNIIWYKTGAFARATRIMQLFQEKWTGPALASTHAEIGWLMGYPVSEIETFVQNGVNSGCYEDR